MILRCWSSNAANERMRYSQKGGAGNGVKSSLRHNFIHVKNLKLLLTDGDSGKLIGE
jgi:hypothetical protein